MEQILNSQREIHLYAQLAFENLDEILVDLVTNTLTSDIKEKLVIPEELNTRVATLSTDVATLKKNMDAYQKLMQDVNAEITRIVSETQKS